MVKLRSYILSNLSILFFSIFLPLFTIASVIFLIKLATYTAYIQLTLVEMGKLYLFVLPNLLFFTLPITFVVSAALTLYRLSNDNEMVVVFSLGISPSYIGKIFMLPAFLLSTLLLFDYLIVNPYIESISDNFLKQKRSEAKFNLTASEFGHKFGDWMLFINRNDPLTHTFQDVVLFNKSFKNEIVIAAKEAQLINDNGSLQLKLIDGKSYSYQDKTLKHINFDAAYINDKLTIELHPFINTYDYWTNNEKRKGKLQRLVTYTLVSLLPILSIFFILAVGIVHARHQKRWIYLWLFIGIITFYALSSILQVIIGFHTIWVMVLFTLIVSYLFYKRLVGSRF